jgi:hypothetical protein
MSIRGSVDGITPEGAFGWAFAVTGERLSVQALFDGRILGETLADQFRHDLAEVGLGDGHCGFAITFYERVDPAILPFVQIRPAGGDVELPRTNETGLLDAFRALHARHPGAGRARCVLGGLWTDRTDAAALLAGRIAAGSSLPEQQPALAALIGHGHAILRDALAGALPLSDAALPTDRPLAPDAEAAELALAEALPAALFRDPVLAVLRAALDDNPVCYRVTLTRRGTTDFAQASTAEALASPAECLALVAGPVALDIVRGSHHLPEFSADGRSRYLAGGAALDAARLAGASVETIEVGARDLVLLGAGTVFRLRAERKQTGLTALIAPRRVTPLRILAEPQRAPVMLRHPSGAALAA